MNPETLDYAEYAEAVIERVIPLPPLTSMKPTPRRDDEDTLVTGPARYYSVCAGCGGRHHYLHMTVCADGKRRCDECMAAGMNEKDNEQTQKQEAIK